MAHITTNPIQVFCPTCKRQAISPWGRYQAVCDEHGRFKRRFTDGLLYEFVHLSGHGSFILKHVVKPNLGIHIWHWKNVK